MTAAAISFRSRSSSAGSARRERVQYQRSVPTFSTNEHFPRGSHELLDSEDPPLAFHRVHADRHRELHRHRAWESSRLGDLFSAAAARLARVHGAVHVRAAVCRQMECTVTARRPLEPVAVESWPVRTSFEGGCCASADWTLA